MRAHISRALPTTGLWQDRGFLNLWAAQTVSAFGSRITRTALPIVAILTIDATPTEIGLLSALSVAPAVLVGVLLGGWIDRSPKRAILIGTDLIRGGLLLTIPLAAWFNLLIIEQLYLVTAVVGALSVAFEIAHHAYLPALVGRGQLVEGNTKLEATDAVAEVGGPSLAGVLVYMLTAPITILFDAVSFFLSAALLGAIRKTEDIARSAIEKVTPSRDFAVGLRAGFGNRLIRPLFLVEANKALFGGFFLTLYMIFTLKTLGLSPATVGVLIGLGGIGALLGTVTARRAEARLGLGPAMFASLLVGQLAGFLIPIASGSRWGVIALLAIHQLVGDAAMVTYSIYATSLRQTVIPQNELGRTTATLHAMTGLLLPAGALVSGWLATQLDIRATIWTGVIGGLLAPLIIALSPIRTLRRMPTVNQ